MTIKTITRTTIILFVGGATLTFITLNPIWILIPIGFVLIGLWVLID